MTIWIVADAGECLEATPEASALSPWGFFTQDPDHVISYAAALTPRPLNGTLAVLAGRLVRLVTHHSSQ